MRKVVKWWSARVSSVLSSPRWLRWGGISLVAGGVLGVVAQVAFVLMFGALPALASRFAYGLLDVIFLLQGFVTPLLAVGLIGVYALAAGQSGRLRKLSAFGLGLVLVSAFVLAGMNAYETLIAPRYITYDPAEGIPLSQKIVTWASWGWPVGAVLLGLGILRETRGMGRWGGLSVALGLLSTPLFYRLLLHSVTGGNPEGGVEGASRILLDAQPILLNLGWALLGYGLLRASGAESVTQTNERLARRVYEEAWGRGEVEVLNELVAPDVVDHYHRQRGRESFKRSVANLRVSFPDLRFVLESQKAEEDRVTTRWTAIGTDRGGVLWYPPTGRAATFSGTFTDRFEEGRLVEHRGESDTKALLRRLGLPPVG